MPEVAAPELVKAVSAMGFLDNIFGGGRNQRIMEIARATEEARLRDEQQARDDRMYADQKKRQLANDKKIADQYAEEKRVAAEAKAGADAAEAERQARIRSGMGEIDTAFGQFDDNWYNGLMTSYTDQYNPTIDKEAAKAKDTLTAALAGRGILESSVGAAKLAEAEEKRIAARTQIGNDALTYADSVKGKVASQKNNLYDVNNSSADPLAVKASAIGDATSLAQSAGTQFQSPGQGGDFAVSTPLTSIPGIFNDLATPFIAGLQANSNKARPGNTGIKASGLSSGGSSRIVG